MLSWILYYGYSLERYDYSWIHPLFCKKIFTLYFVNADIKEKKFSIV